MLINTIIMRHIHIFLMYWHLSARKSHLENQNLKEGQILQTKDVPFFIGFYMPYHSLSFKKKYAMTSYSNDPASVEQRGVC